MCIDKASKLACCADGKGTSRILSAFRGDGVPTIELLRNGKTTSPPGFPSWLPGLRRAQTPCSHLDRQNRTLLKTVRSTNEIDFTIWRKILDVFNDYVCNDS